MIWMGQNWQSSLLHLRLFAVAVVVVVLHYSL